ncbi:hypothetical protein NSK_008752 [Nannochloropsis salina CCMP1776]|uniref:Uncharacterized protein n=1 Tax=Nannochloropsis salina CCMP1776 TaxID=1027361 RepID=A0A4D9CLD7_9STRA|nr:hypothetical protein NSK_008752 [Nannochloropsis salina CCMP1776]|eukprot:TFJ79911.1 hypothetical protein NSK_008752 [Nannochloropsis salina CCMP1776]
MTVTADPADGDREHGPSDTASMARPGVEDRIKHLLAAGVKDSAYEALQLFSSQAKRHAKEGDVNAGVGIALQGKGRRRVVEGERGSATKAEYIGEGRVTS